MTTTVAEPTPNEYPERTTFAVGAGALVLGMAALQAFQGRGTHEFRSWLIISAIGLVSIGVVLWGILPRIRPTGRAAIVFAVLAAVSIVVFWLDIRARHEAGGCNGKGVLARARPRCAGACGVRGRVDHRLADSGPAFLRGQLARQPI